VVTRLCTLQLVDIVRQTKLEKLAFELAQMAIRREFTVSFPPGSGLRGVIVRQADGKVIK